MKKPAVLIQKIKQKDNYTFTIEWSDGDIKNYRLSQLQKNCPCAGCVDESTGQRVLDEQTVNEDVRAVRIVSIGRYALKIQFTSGCSNGIFDFDSLRYRS